MSVDAPREGLPPCLRIAMLGDRAAILADSGVCGHSWVKRFAVSAAHINPARRVSGLPEHPEFKRWVATKWVIDRFIDDPAEAKAAFERAERWVRTGELAD